MTRTRLRIGHIMVLAAIIAFDGLLVREMDQSHVDSADMEWCLAGILPMANVLAIAIDRLVVLKSRESRPFWLGIVYFGAAALVVSTILAWYVPEAVRYPIKALVYPIFVRLGSPEGLSPLFVAVPAAFVQLPQMLLGLIGGLAFRRFGVALTAVR